MTSEGGKKKSFLSVNNWQELGVIRAGPSHQACFEATYRPQGPSLDSPCPPSRRAPPSRLPVCAPCPGSPQPLSHFLPLPQSSLMYPGPFSPGSFSFSVTKEILFLLTNYWTTMEPPTLRLTYWGDPWVSTTVYLWGWWAAEAIASVRKGTKKFPSHRTCNLTSFSEQIRGMWFLLTGLKHIIHSFYRCQKKNGSPRETENVIRNFLRKISPPALKPKGKKLHLSVRRARNFLRCIKGIYRHKSLWAARVHRWRWPLRQAECSGLQRIFIFKTFSWTT